MSHSAEASSQEEESEMQQQKKPSENEKPSAKVEEQQLSESQTDNKKQKNEKSPTSPTKQQQKGVTVDARRKLQPSLFQYETPNFFSFAFRSVIHGSELRKVEKVSHGFLCCFNEWSKEANLHVWLDRSGFIQHFDMDKASKAISHIPILRDTKSTGLHDYEKILLGGYSSDALRLLQFKPERFEPKIEKENKKNTNNNNTKKTVVKDLASVSSASSASSSSSVAAGFEEKEQEEQREGGVEVKKKIPQFSDFFLCFTLLPRPTTSATTPAEPLSFVTNNVTDFNHWVVALYRILAVLSEQRQNESSGGGGNKKKLVAEPPRFEKLPSALLGSSSAFKKLTEAQVKFCKEANVFAVDFLEIRNTIVKFRDDAFAIKQQQQKETQPSTSTSTCEEQTKLFLREPKLRQKLQQQQQQQQSKGTSSPLSSPSSSSPPPSSSPTFSPSSSSSSSFLLLLTFSEFSLLVAQKLGIALDVVRLSIMYDFFYYSDNSSSSSENQLIYCRDSCQASVLTPPLLVARTVHVSKAEAKEKKAKEKEECESQNESDSEKSSTTTESEK